MEASEMLYKYIEFFFSKDDLKTMMTIKPFSYESWLDSLYDLYSKKPEDETIFHYNIMHTTEFEIINKYIKKIEELSNNQNESNESNKSEINKLFKEIEDQYDNLYYYEETYLYAHYIFNNIRKNIIEEYKQLGGGHISLEDFKQKIRDKINNMYRV